MVNWGLMWVWNWGFISLINRLIARLNLNDFTFRIVWSLQNPRGCTKWASWQVPLAGTVQVMGSILNLIGALWVGVGVLLSAHFAGSGLRQKERKKLQSFNCIVVAFKLIYNLVEMKCLFHVDSTTSCSSSCYSPCYFRTASTSEA